MFIPFYAASDLEYLFKVWSMGSLDGIHSKGHAIVGVTGADRASHGFRAQNLLERYTAADVARTIEEMARAQEPLPTYAAILTLKHVGGYPLQDISRAFDHDDCTHTQSSLIEAQDEFMTRLLQKA